MKPKASEKGQRLNLINEHPYKTVSWSWYSAFLFFFLSLSLQGRRRLTEPTQRPNGRPNIILPLVLKFRLGIDAASGCVRVTHESLATR